jgi:hypothetical protein
MGKAAQRQIVAEIQTAAVTGQHSRGPAFNGYFAQVSGGEITASVEKVYDGGAKFPETLCAPAEIGDITVTRFYDPDRDGAALKVVRSLVGSTYYNLNIFDLDCDLKVYGTERVYPNALLVGLTEPEGDSSSGAPSTFSLTFSISQVSGQTLAGRIRPSN